MENLIMEALFEEFHQQSGAEADLIFQGRENLSDDESELVFSVAFSELTLADKLATLGALRAARKNGSN